MNIFNKMDEYDYEQIIFCHDKNAGLKAIIAIHDTTLGPALGGARMRNYDTEEEALQDALRLAKGMTYKNAAAGLNLGGGKAVILGNPTEDKKEELFRAFGRYVESLNGRYITAEDMGTKEEDMNIIHMETDYVAGISKEDGSSGDPAPVTAYGLYHGIKASAKEAYGDSGLKGKVIAVQGMGNVAYTLCEYLYEEGAKLIVTDVHEERVQMAVEAFDAVAVEPEAIYDVDCDIFCPCAIGAIINEETIPRLKAKVIAGSANNQLKSDADGDLLDEKGIVYAPDYVINSGGVIYVTNALSGYNDERALNKVKTIYNSLEKVFEIAKRDQIPTYQAADRMAEERIAAVRNSSHQFLRRNHHMLTRYFGD
jgi:leucine dehydrogenase